MRSFRHSSSGARAVSAPVEGASALAPRAVERLARLRGDLRLGLPAVLVDGPDAALIGWVETLTEERLAALTAMGAPELALTRHRAAALTRAALPGGDVLRLVVPCGVDLAWLAARAGQGAEAVAESGEATLPVLEAATPLHRAAVALAKSAQVLPAALIVPVRDAHETAQRLGLTVMRADEALDAIDEAHPQRCVSSARLPMDVSEAGRVHVFRPGDGGIEHYAIEVGRPDLDRTVTVRLHSACFTGDVLGSLKCDCGAQLRSAMATMAASGGGVLLYLNQEGRGIGLANKMRAYALQEGGLDTVEANYWLGFDDDQRDFRTGADILRRMGIGRVRLMTNNPAKVAILHDEGIDVAERVPLEVGRTAQNARYLATKAAKSGHLLA